MTKNTITLFSLAIMLIFACNTSDAPTSSDSLAPTSAPSSTQKEKPRSREDLKEKEKQGIRLPKKPLHESAKKALSMKEKNMTSPYKYLTTSDEYPIFTYLMSRSNLTKHIHNAGVTVLAPVDKAFNDYPNYKELLLKINQEELDNFIAYHIIDTPLSDKAFSLGDSWRVHAGLILSITRGEGVNFNGAHVRSGSVNTDHGMIIGMDDLVYYPKISR
ncbi:MAG: fasciclin domain-containing protein [Flavobacteriales bacterium]|nr:fasciclin domain-containing protein [Flavobacteriales bacterium]